MRNKSRSALINIGLILCLLTILISDYWLLRFGQGVLIFKAKLPSGITIKYDNLQGYKFLEEGFIHILNEFTIFGKDTINSILAYDATEYDVFVKSTTTNGKTLYLNIHVLESLNGELKYEIRDYKSRGIENWIDVSNRRSIRFVVTLRNILAVIMLILLLAKLFGLIRSAIVRRT